MTVPDVTVLKYATRYVEIGNRNRKSKGIEDELENDESEILKREKIDQQASDSTDSKKRKLGDMEIDDVLEKRKKNQLSVSVQQCKCPKI